MVKIFTDAFNDYSCIKDTNANKIYHYTEHIEAVEGICSGTFRFTDMLDLEKDDHYEGILILKKLYNELSYIYKGDTGIAKHVEHFIGSDDSIEMFINRHKTFVLSCCLNPNSEYMWKEYSKEDGYEIILDREKFLKSARFLVNNEFMYSNYFKYGEIQYGEETQERIIKKEFNRILEASKVGLTEIDRVRYAIEHLMYTGNFYKQKKYKDEEEYRVLLNTHHYYDSASREVLPKLEFNEKNKKHYIDVKFDKKAVIGVVCKNDKAFSIAKQNLSDNRGIKIVIKES